jgi:CheY-like chemotaxis protein
MKTNPPNVLLVEDNEDDVFLMQRALKAARLDVTLTVMDDGEKALEYLERVAQGQAPRPDLVLLDLKLPYVHGFEVLEFIRGNAELKDFDVFVLTSSGELRDQERATALNARGYHVKPPTPAMVAEVAKFLAAEA